jgi:tubulin gamma
VFIHLHHQLSNNIITRLQHNHNHNLQTSKLFNIQLHQGQCSNQSHSKSIKMTQSKDQKIAETQANLPLPDQPPTASDWQSADARNVNVGSGKQEGHIGTDAAAQSGLREPATKGEEVDLSNVGREGVEKNQQ